MNSKETIDAIINHLQTVGPLSVNSLFLSASFCGVELRLHSRTDPEVWFLLNVPVDFSYQYSIVSDEEWSTKVLRPINETP